MLQNQCLLRMALKEQFLDNFSKMGSDPWLKNLPIKYCSFLKTISINSLELLKKRSCQRGLCTNIPAKYGKVFSSHLQICTKTSVQISTIFAPLKRFFLLKSIETQLEKGRWNSNLHNFVNSFLKIERKKWPLRFCPFHWNNIGIQAFFTPFNPFIFPLMVFMNCEIAPGSKFFRNRF